MTGEIEKPAIRRKEDGTFEKGCSGNISGRPKNTLKDYVRKMFSVMSDEEKKEWLEKQKVSGIDIWKMAEGNPENKSDFTSNGEGIQPILVKFINGDKISDNRDTGGI